MVPGTWASSLQNMHLTNRAISGLFLFFLFFPFFLQLLRPSSLPSSLPLPLSLPSFFLFSILPSITPPCLPPCLFSPLLPLSSFFFPPSFLFLSCHPAVLFMSILLFFHLLWIPSSSWCLCQMQLVQTLLEGVVLGWGLKVGVVGATGCSIE